LQENILRHSKFFCEPQYFPYRHLGRPSSTFIYVIHVKVLPSLLSRYLHIHLAEPYHTLFFAMPMLSWLMPERCQVFIGQYVVQYLIIYLHQIQTDSSRRRTLTGQPSIRESATQTDTTDPMSASSVLSQYHWCRRILPRLGLGLLRTPMS